jgi:putative protease
LPYDLEDDNGHKILTDKHLLSLRDLNQSMRLKAMIDAGVSSFKIEGRLKDAGYVKNVVAYYRCALDKVIDNADGELIRSSFGHSTYSFEPRLERSFNRSFTHYFIDGHPASTSMRMASIDTPKSMGEPIGHVLNSHGSHLRVDGDVALVNGDGLSYIGADGRYTGVRVNEVHGSDIILNDKVNIKCGTSVYRTFDKCFNDILSRPSATRKIAVDMSLRVVGDTIVADVDDERGNHVVHTIHV